MFYLHFLIMERFQNILLKPEHTRQRLELTLKVHIYDMSNFWFFILSLQITRRLETSLVNQLSLFNWQKPHTKQQHKMPRSSRTDPQIYSNSQKLVNTWRIGGVLKDQWFQIFQRQHITSLLLIHNRVIIEVFLLPHLHPRIDLKSNRNRRNKTKINTNIKHKKSKNKTRLDQTHLRIDPPSS